ncbi:DUF726 domain-containing protein [Clostridium tagluense]|uniref:DUF726 domain-containing protein n=1 Tax=Clostridium tagluense TaxID=360422 RepID=UPI001CF54D82|nr:DUF726 domain-containing protein [Clostridium tagluense]MCB2312081.1 DUF726 domain-containing protein [Clostridium tagluense]MCB2316734.1 DUF726 domain-containing protein [Clostridium tagluense]MCB2321526.1 DUF726 domain-containing protein [Clostridium tagluense]MCB2326603.1 DUF726 domain-containing protein [Clostridium tagluense]MCB2331326.1 DUF726 domain-containing protein [Clostridium tagluense]
MDGLIESINDFKIDGYGYALIIKLVEMRVLADIETTEKRLNEAGQKLIKLKNNDTIFVNIKISMIQKDISKLQLETNNKKIWLSKWIHMSWKSIEEYNTYQVKEKSVQQILSKFNENEENILKKYLILQEAVLTPIYAELEGFPKGISEIDQYHNCEVISETIEFPRNLGKSILKNTESFLKGLNNHWDKMFKWAVAGVAVTVITAGIAAPAIAGAVGGLMGLHGAAATAAGFAFFGGGAIASGGFGMAGGLSVIIGGGSILGAVGGFNIAKMIGDIQHEYISISMIKIANYISYLSTVEEPNKLKSQQIIKRIVNKFLNLKHNIETETLLGNCNNDIDKYLKTIKTMDYTYGKLIEYLIKK